MGYPRSFAFAGLVLALSMPPGASACGTTPCHDNGHPRRYFLVLALSANSVTGGGTLSAAVSLSEPAAAPMVLDIMNSVPAAASMPPSVSFNTGDISARFTITAIPVATSTSVQVSVGQNRVPSAAATFAVQPPRATSLTLTPTRVTGGTSISVALALDGPAPAGGLPVPLTTSDSTIVVPTALQVAAGSARGTAQLTTRPVADSTRLSIVARAPGGLASTIVDVLKPVPVELTLSPTRVRRGYPTLATLRLNGPAPAGGIQPLISVTGASVRFSTPPAVPAGQTTVPFFLTPSCCSALQDTATLTVLGASGLSARLVILPIVVTQVATQPSVVLGGDSYTVTATLDTVAPPSGFSITMRGRDATDFTQTLVPVVIGAGSRTGGGVAPSTPTGDLRRIVWVAPGFVAQDTVRIHPPETRNLLLGGSSVIGGNGLSRSSASIVSSAPAPVTLVVTFTPPIASVSDGLTRTDPTGAIIAAGATSTSFGISTTGVAQPTTVTVTARSYDLPQAVRQTASFTILPAGLVQLAVSPDTVKGAFTASGVVTLNGAAPPGGATVSLASSSTAASVPATVTVPAGARSATFAVTPPPTRGAKTITVTVTATFSGQAKSTPLVVIP